MAYDPEARRQSNSALIIGLVALLLLGGATLAYFASRRAEPEVVPTVVQGRDTTVVVQATAAPGPAVVVTSPPSVVAVPVPGTTIIKQPGTNKTVTRNTTITRDTRIVTPPVSGGSTRSGSTAPAGGSNSTNVTVNNVVPTTAPATGSGTGTTSDTTTPATNAGAANSAATTNAASGSGY